MANKFPLISINIPTLNSGKTLKKTLESIYDQTFQHFEIIIMDSHSTDNTLSLARTFGAKVVQADTLAKARKEGFMASHGKYIMLLDSDQVMDNNVLQVCWNTCEKENYAGITLFEKSIIQQNNFVEKVIAYDKDLFHRLQDDNPVYGTAIPRFFRSELYGKIDFDSNPTITFEHTLLHKAIEDMGGKIKFVNAYLYHYETITSREICRKFFRYGKHVPEAFKVNKKVAIFHSLPRRTYFHPLAFRNPIMWIGLWYVYLLKAVSATCGAVYANIHK